MLPVVLYLALCLFVMSFYVCWFLDIVIKWISCYMYVYKHIKTPRPDVLTEIWHLGSKYVFNMFTRRVNSYQIKSLYLFLSKWNSKKFLQNFL